MDSLAQILKDKGFSEPPEIKRLKLYILKEYGAESVIRLSRGDLVVSVKSASLASLLRLSSPEIAKTLNITQNLRFNVG